MLEYLRQTSFKSSLYTVLNSSVAEPEPQGAASFGRSRSRNEMWLRLRRFQLPQRFIKHG
jgi:hypothetical protein